jgi:hypothetical protein
VEGGRRTKTNLVLCLCCMSRARPCDRQPRSRTHIEGVLAAFGHFSGSNAGRQSDPSLVEPSEQHALSASKRSAPTSRSPALPASAAVACPAQHAPALAKLVEPSCRGHLKRERVNLIRFLLQVSRFSLCSLSLSLSLYIYIYI